MKPFYGDEWDEAYDDLIYEEEIEEDKNAQYFDVPLPYRPVEIRTFWKFQILE